MSNIFKTYLKEDKRIIERLSYPRFKGVVTYSGDLSDIEEIELLDDTTNPLELAKALREAGDYLTNYKPE